MEPMEPAHECLEIEETAVHVLSPMIEFFSPPDKIKE